LKALITLWITTLFLLHGQAVRSQGGSGRFSPEKTAFVPCPGGDSSLAILLATNSASRSAEEALFFMKLENMAGKLEKGRKKTDHGRILKGIFMEGRRQFLRSYDKNYPHFSRLFTDGSYNCLTGSAMYAWVLERLGYQVQIHETAFHAYLTLRADNVVYLFDATDPENGFVVGAAAVGKRELWYTGNELQKGANFHRSISLRQLCGLQYYNQGVVAFNARDFDQSLNYLRIAQQLYPQSERILKLEEMAQQHQREVLAFATGRTFVNTSNEKRPGGE
jgi:hypothetical protein